MEPMMQPLQADGGTKPGQDVGPKGPKSVAETKKPAGDNVLEALAEASLAEGTDPDPDVGPKGPKALPEEGASVLFEGGSDPEPDDGSKGDKGL